MKSFKALFIATCIASLAGCNSESNSTKEVKDNSPSTNYVFSDEELEGLLDERVSILSSVKMNFDGKAYNEVKFSEQLDSEQWVVKLQNAEGSTIDLWLNNEGDSDSKCLIYRDSKFIEIFDCSDTARTTTEETTVIQSSTQDGSSEVQIEILNQAVELVGIIGSTVLTVKEENNQATITTSFAFDGFFEDVLNFSESGERANATLGMSTYLQMDEITTQFEGTKMTLNFANHIGGSADDDINMYTGLMIRDNNMTTQVSPTGSVFSGGTDLFAAGVSRILKRSSNTDSIEENMQIGVHSWSDGENSALDIPFSDKSHQRQATYFDKMLGETGLSFYLFTLDSAPAEGRHWITRTESDKYSFITNIE